MPELYTILYAFIPGSIVIEYIASHGNPDWNYVLLFDVIVLLLVALIYLGVYIYEALYTIGRLGERHNE